MKRVIVVGAGPIGLHAALQAVASGFDVMVLERGEVAAAIRGWGHVRLFTPFGMNSTTAGRDTAARFADLPASDALLTGDEYIRRYLMPLANSPALDGRIHTDTEVLAVSRQALGKSDAIGQPQRARSAFRLLVRRTDGSEEINEADILLDCTGFTTRHRFVGIGGIPCPGERDCLTASNYTVASPSDPPAEHTVVIGSGYSAATSVWALQETSQRITWITRANRDAPIQPVLNDPLAERRQLTDEANRLALDPDSRVVWMPGAQIESMQQDGEQLTLGLVRPDGQAETLHADRVVANPGFRPDSRPFEELQVHRCYATDGPIKLAAHLLGEVGEDCLSQAVPGAELLKNPEPNFFILGAASYGRDSRFLLQNGLEQVEQLFDQILDTTEIAI